MTFLTIGVGIVIPKWIIMAVSTVAEGVIQEAKCPTGEIVTVTAFTFIVDFRCFMALVACYSAGMPNRGIIPGGRAVAV